MASRSVLRDTEGMGCLCDALPTLRLPAVAGLRVIIFLRPIIDL